MVEGARPNCKAMARIDNPPTIPLDISSRSDSDSANPDRCLCGGRIPPLGDNRPNIEDDSLSNTRPIELIDSPRCQRSQISALWAAVYFIRVLYLIFYTPYLIVKVEVLHRSVEITALTSHYSVFMKPGLGQTQRRSHHSLCPNFS
jgi:hypothetical protein